jgi:iron complex transport system substrate-binding protein
LDKPTIKELMKRMTNKYIVYVTTMIAVVSILAAAIMYVNYTGQIADLKSQVKNLQNSQNNISNDIVDDTPGGYVTKLTSVPGRIVSLAPACTEILYALGLGDKVVAVTDYDNYPYNFTAWIAAGNMTSVGQFESPNREVIVSLNPDLILAASIQKDLVINLRDNGYKVLVLNPTSLTGVLQDISFVGRAANKTVEAAALVSNMSNRINAIANKVANATTIPKVYYEVWYDPTSLWSVGSQSFENELISKAGGVNLFENESLGYFQSSSEAVITENPDWIILPYNHGTGAPFWGTLADVKARPGWDSINAIKNDHFIQIDADLLAHAGPRLVDALEQIAHQLHPELFA